VTLSFTSLLQKLQKISELGRMLKMSSEPRPTCWTMLVLLCSECKHRTLSLFGHH